MPDRVLATVVVDGLTFPESLRWRDGRLWFSDYYDRCVFSLDPVGGALENEAFVEGLPSGLGWLPDGRLLVVSRRDRRVLRREHDGTLGVHADLEAWAAGDANDLVVDGEGRAYVDHLGFDPFTWFRDGGSFADAPTADLLAVDLNGTVRVVADGLAVPNGVVLTPDGTRLIVAETFASRLTVFDVDHRDGSLSNRRTWAVFNGRSPDGIATDADGSVWVADTRHHECVRVCEGGEITTIVETSQTCYACAVGGVDGRTLYCATAPSPEENDAVARRAGRIERADIP